MAKRLWADEWYERQRRLMAAVDHLNGKYSHDTMRCGLTVELAQKAEGHCDLPEWVVAILNGAAAAALIVAGVKLYADCLLKASRKAIRAFFFTQALDRRVVRGALCGGDPPLVIYGER